MIIRPPATIFDLTTIATGLLVLAAAAILGRAGFVRTATVPLGLYCLGALLVGVFPGNWGNVHVPSALLTFVAGGAAAITAVTAVRGPLRIIAPVLGAISLLTLAANFALASASPMDLSVQAGSSAGSSARPALRPRGRRLPHGRRRPGRRGHPRRLTAWS